MSTLPRLLRLEITPPQLFAGRCRHAWPPPQRPGGHGQMNKARTTQARRDKCSRALRCLAWDRQTRRLRGIRTDDNNRNGSASTPWLRKATVMDGGIASPTSRVKLNGRIRLPGANRWQAEASMNARNLARQRLGKRRIASGACDIFNQA